MTQDGHNMFSAHHSKTTMSCRLLMCIFWSNSEWITCIVFHLWCCVCWHTLWWLLRLETGDYCRLLKDFHKGNLIKQCNPFPLPPAIHSLLSLRLNVSCAEGAGLPTLCGVHLLRNAITVHIRATGMCADRKNCDWPSQGDALCSQPRTRFPVLDDMRQVEERLSNFLFCGNARQIPILLSGKSHFQLLLAAFVALRR